MGTPEFRAAQIPVVSLGEYVLEHKITVCGENYTMTCLSMGNPHAVIPVEDVEKYPLQRPVPLLNTFPASRTVSIQSLSRL